MDPETISRQTIFAYVGINGLFTLSASLIWAINTIFLIQIGHLNLFEVTLVNSVYTLGQMVFEVPTGVVADTIGRRFSIIASMLTVAAGTSLYVIAPALHMGIGGFFLASVLLGLGYTMQTGAMDAWLVDSLDANHWIGAKDRIFASGQIAASVGMLAGSLLGGLLGQVNLSWPYILRVILLLGCFLVAIALVKDRGFEPRPLVASRFAEETRKIFSAGVAFGLHSPVVRPLLWTSALSGIFFMYGFYAWQPYVLKLAGGNYVWLLGVVQAASAAAGIGGNLYVRRMTREGKTPRNPADILVIAAVVNAALVVAIGLIGLVWHKPGFVPAGIAIVLWLGWGFAWGVSMPVRMSFLNAHVPSAQRATVLSFDAFFLDGGSAAGQPVLGWVSDRWSISVAWLIGGAVVASSAPFYVRSGRAADQERASVDEVTNR